MTLSLSQVILAARDRHPAFFKTRVTDAVLARYLTDYQNDLIVRAAASNPTYCQQSAVVVLAFDDADAVGTAGAGTTGGVPGTVSGGDVQIAEGTTGALITVGLTADDGAAVVVSDRVVTSATDTATTSTGAGRTTDEDVGRLLVIVAGTGTGQRREITANTAESWSHAAWSDTSGWVTPDTTSLLRVVSPVYLADETAGVVTDLPALETRTGYLVKLDASGVPVIDFTTPLVASVETGVPLPSLHQLLGGTIRYTSGDTEDLTVTSYARRHDATPTAAVYPVGETIRFCGEAADWADIASLELLYTPVAPTFTRLTDLFLVPDAAKSCLVATAAAFMALRVDGTEHVTIDPSAYEALAAKAETTYLTSVAYSHRNRRNIMRGQD